MRPVFLNGKFTAQRTTGVQRVAAHLVQALDAERPPGRWVLLCPPQGHPPALRHIEVRRVGPADLPLHLWEQLLLPWVARQGWLVNLAGAAPALGRRQVVLMHDAAVFDHPEAYTWAFGHWYRSLYRQLARRRTGLMTVSAFSRERLAAALQVHPERFTVLHNGADHLRDVRPDEQVLDQHGLRGVPFLLAVGSANPTKNLARLLTAFATLPAGTIKLVLVGGSNAKVFAAAPVSDPAGVVRTGPLEDRALVALYRHARALVFPSVYEGFGLPPLEAMACGCPVAVARAAAMPEVCAEAAAYFDPVDEFDIARTMMRLASDAPWLARLRAAGHARAAAFRWQSTAQGLLHNIRLSATVSSS